MYGTARLSNEIIVSVEGIESHDITGSVKPIPVLRMDQSI